MRGVAFHSGNSSQRMCLWKEVIEDIYNTGGRAIFRYMKKVPRNSALYPVIRVPLNPANVTDIWDLNGYLKEERNQFYQNIFEECTPQDVSTGKCKLRTAPQRVGGRGAGRGGRAGHRVQNAAGLASLTGPTDSSAHSRPQAPGVREAQHLLPSRLRGRGIANSNALGGYDGYVAPAPSIANANAMRAIANANAMRAIANANALGGEPVVYPSPSIANANAMRAIANANAMRAISNANALGGGVANSNAMRAISNANALGGGWGDYGGSIANSNAARAISNANALGGGFGGYSPSVANANAARAISNANALRSDRGYSPSVANANAARAISNANALGAPSVANANAMRAIANANALGGEPEVYHPAPSVANANALG
ncbi:Hypothetical accessory gland protein [Gryllus bimaculatus]|nr:Hypothetical accessory gland protein [Gryllus bimaculatus]